MQELFSKLKVVDLSTVLAGPSVATFFAELGAHVTKIENPSTGGDVTRSWKLPQENDSPISAYYVSANFNKHCLWLDLLDSVDKGILMDLLANTDVLVTNFKPGDNEKFGLTEENLFRINPRIILARLTGFETDTHRIAYDVVLQAETGFMDMNGTTTSGPVKMPVALIDVLAAHQLKEAILCALLKRHETGVGSVVDCSLEKAALASLYNQATNYLMSGVVAKRSGSLHPNIAPYGEIFYCLDERPIVLAIGSEKQFSTLCEIVGTPLLSRDVRFSTNTSRVRHREILAEYLGSIFISKTRTEWMELFNASSIPAGAIKSIDEVMAGSTAQDMILTEEIEGVITKRLSTVAFELTSRTDLGF
jgi:crotonobetainyl-CoA:carnitine CoA-transferase CaiB-like acyl-CoA transferase